LAVARDAVSGASNHAFVIEVILPTLDAPRLLLELANGIAAMNAKSTTTSESRSSVG
jgi:TPP-dependent 2-oxoacid decarboxylase